MSPGFQPFPETTAFRRWSIHPLYWLFTAAVVLVFVVNESWHLGGFEFTPEQLLVSFLILPQTGYPILPLGWTLEYEVIFYAAVALFLVVAPVRTLYARLCFALAIGLLALAGSNLPASLAASPWVNHLFTPYLFAFGFGWLIQVLLSAGTAAPGWTLPAFALLFAWALFLADEHDAVLLHRVALACGFVALVLWLPRTGGGNPRLAGAVARIGEASYSLYLSHWFVLSVFGKIVATWPAPAAFDWTIRLSGLALALALGCLFHRFVEMPLDRFVKRPGASARAAIEAALPSGEVHHQRAGPPSRLAMSVIAPPLVEPEADGFWAFGDGVSPVSPTIDADCRAGGPAEPADTLCVSKRIDQGD